MRSIRQRLFIVLTVAALLLLITDAIVFLQGGAATGPKENASQQDA